MIAQLLEELGYTADEASIIRYMLKNAEVTQYNIERECNICQPRVSNAIRALHKKGIASYIKKPALKGKSIKYYSLNVIAITNGPEEQIKSDYEHKMKVFKALNDNL